MSKSTVVRTWLAGVITFAGGLALAGVCVGLMLGFAGTFTPAAGGQGYDFQQALDGVFWATVAGVVLGGIVAAIGGVVQFVGWIGAMVNTYSMPDKTWFGILLAGGVVGLMFGLVGLAVMIAYVIAGPDGVALTRERERMGGQTGALIPTAQ
jgi:hypothetical protein